MEVSAYLYTWHAFPMSYGQLDVGYRLVWIENLLGHCAPSLGSDLRFTAIGVLIGALLTVGMARLIAGLLFGVKPADPLTYILVVAGLITVALAA